MKANKKVYSLKISVLLFLLNIFCFEQSVSAQIKCLTIPQLFPLNSPYHQFDISLSLYDNALAYVEYKKVDDTVSAFKTFDTHFLDKEWKVIVFPSYRDKASRYAPMGFDPDGNVYAAHLQYHRGIYVGEVIKLKPDGQKEVIDIPYLKVRGDFQNGFINKNEDIILLSYQGNNTYGVEDIYVSLKKKDKWTSPINLGKRVNTDFQEISPFLAKDNKTLFFSTNGRDGQGSFDIFYTKRLDDTWRNWSPPKNIGSPINTAGSETSFVFKKNESENPNHYTALYSASHNSRHYGDIKWVEIDLSLEEELPSDSTVAKDSIQILVQKEEALDTTMHSGNKLIIEVQDEKTHTLVNAEILGDMPSHKSEMGTFEIDTALITSFEIKADGYFSKFIYVSELRSDECIISLTPLKKGSHAVLSHVLFKRGTPHMLAGTEQELDLLLEMMIENPSVKILLKGHTDNQGNPASNLKLSEERAESVKKYLVDRGIRFSRIEGAGFGGAQPTVSNESEETRRLNRRVEFEIIED